MYNLTWSRSELNSQKLGVFCECYAKMALISYGLDVYSSEVDDHGVDFVAESKSGFLKFQVKSIRLSKSSYVFMPKKYFNIEDPSLYLFLILLTDGEHPETFLIPTSAWKQESKVFVCHNYEGKKSEPEYGVNVSKRNKAELDKYKLENILAIVQ